MATLLDLVEWYRGDSYPLELIIKEKDGDPIDITGYSFILTVDTKEKPEDVSTKLFDVVGVLDGDPTTGKVSFTPSSSDTGTIGKYFFDIQMTDADGNIRTITKNKWTIYQDITKI